MVGGKLIGIVLGIFIGFIVTSLTVLLIFLFGYYSIHGRGNQSKSISDPEAASYLDDETKFGKVIRRMFHVMKIENNEKWHRQLGETQERSNGYSSANWIDSNASVGNLVINLSDDASATNSDYLSALDDLGNNLKPQVTKEPKIVDRELNGVAILNPLTGGNENYDSFSQTLYLQNLTDKSDSKDTLNVNRIRDPYSDSYISVGGIVVVIHPFKGSLNTEFSNLQPGDLLRIVKFYIKEDAISVGDNNGRITAINPTIDIADYRKELSCSMFNDRTSEYSLDSYLASVNLNYSNIYCSGIILNTYLEFNKCKDNLTLKIRDMPLKNNLEMYKDFPLNVVSLETTVLRSLVTTS